MKLKHLFWVLGGPLFLVVVPLAQIGFGTDIDLGKSEVSNEGHSANTKTLSASCLLEDLHPLQVSVRLVDPMQPEAWMKAEIFIESSIDLDNLQIEFRPTSEVLLAGPRKASVSHLAAQEKLVQSMTLKVPNKKAQQQVGVVVSGFYQGYEIQRGTTLNLLAQGPHHPGVLSATPSRSGDVVIEYPGAARRIR